MVLNLNKSCLICGGEVVELTKNEFCILYYFMKQRGKMVTHEELMTYLWDSNLFVDDNTLTVKVNRLPKKLAAVAAEPIIKTKRGIGYLS